MGWVWARSGVGKWAGRELEEWEGDMEGGRNDGGMYLPGVRE